MTQPQLLADHTTLRVGGPAKRFVMATTDEEIIETITECDRNNEPVLIVSGGSNLVIGDDGFAGTVISIETKGIEVDACECSGSTIKVKAGEVWDDVVKLAVESEWVGLECLSGIPGLAGSTPVQNVGAYGAEISQMLASVRTYDRHTGGFATFAVADCGFGYRTSRFRQELGRYVILEACFQLPYGSLSMPLRHGELVDRLGIIAGKRAPLGEVRDTVLKLRCEKGMVLDASDHDTWSAGSFFTNPVLDAGFSLPEGAPSFDAGEGRIKTSAAWLIEHAGFEKGYARGAASLSTKHVLAVTNRGSASAADVLGLAREVRDGVADRFGITLVPEPMIVGAEF